MPVRLVLLIALTLGLGGMHTIGHVSPEHCHSVSADHRPDPSSVCVAVAASPVVLVAVLGGALPPVPLPLALPYGMRPPAEPVARPPPRTTVLRQ
ncbi:hypothetical protein [Nonomuraea soli]|uniref:Uncharacterized protein n=1 Tax=Nonomuraea soli TaxID=1032476 RepID=A0A7W0HRD2_9ACTN|nr:hypothetical protein [Nonomuraea soli]MBA2892883.1 hypothetical protein [Nonomuraea soli]